MTRIAIIGAGAWGTALAQAARAAGRDVGLWAHDPAVAEAIAREGGNTRYLPEVPLTPGIAATSDLAVATRGADAVVLATPAQRLREVAGRLAPSVPRGVPTVIAAKGIEADTGLLMREVLAEAMPDAPPAVLAGPTFAGEVARGLPAAATLAADDLDRADALVELLGSRAFRLYASADLVGAQLGGAVKNVVAIAAGIVAGRGLGENARAALITRGLAEMTRLGAARGADPATLAGLSGLGDLSLTCTGIASRNYTLGLALGEGMSLHEVLAARKSVTEGIFTAGALTRMAAANGVDMPIAAAVDGVVNGGEPVAAVIERLLARPFRAEHDPGGQAAG